MAGAQPEERVRTPLAFQRWRDVTFLHWRYDPEVVARLLPPALAPDVRDGAAWVSLTPMRIEDFRPLGLPPLPGLSRYPETNLRTYVRDRRGVDGLWFFSLDVASPTSVVATRAALGAPYFPAWMRVQSDGAVRYESRRLLPPGASHRITVRAHATPVDDSSSLSTWLAGRWRAYTRWARWIFEVPVEHQPWPLQTAELEELDETMLRAAALPPPDDLPIVQFSPGVDARLGPPRIRGSAGGR